MDRKKFEEKVEEYLLFDKRSLAEMLAMRDLKEEEDSEGYINNAEGSKVWIYGGEITNNSGEAIENRGSITVGINDAKGQVNVSTPIICGSTYGIYNYTSTASIGFYDGIIKGKTRPMNNFCILIFIL